MLEAGEADLALLSHHVRGASSVRLITRLYEEMLQVVVRRDTRIAAPHDLVGRRARGRFANVCMADRIVVLEASGVVEDGPHERLLAAGGLYAAMFRKRARDYAVAC